MLERHLTLSGHRRSMLVPRTDISNHRRTGIRYPCRNDHYFIIKRQIHVSGRYYFCVKEGSSVRCNPSRFRTESLRDSGNRKTVTANYRNDNFNVPDHCISVT